VPLAPAPRNLGLAVAGLLAGLVFANLAQLPRLELQGREARADATVFVRSGSGDAAEMGLAAGSTIRRRRGLFLLLQIHAPGAEIHVPPGSSLDVHQLYGLGLASRVVEVEYDPASFAAGLDLDEFVVADDEDGYYGPVPFSLVIGQTPPEALAVRRSGERTELIDLALVPATEREVFGR
jgi:hypothetical protein